MIGYALIGLGEKQQSTWSNSDNKKQTEYKAKVHVAVNYVSIKSKQLKRLKYPILFLQELDHILTLNMDVFSQSIMAIIKTFGGYKT